MAARTMISSDRTTMHIYRVFGGCLRSDLELPLLLDAPPGAMEWTVRRVAAQPPGTLELLGTKSSDGAVQVDFYRTAHGIRVAVSDVGDFDIDASTGMIAWTPGEHDCIDCAQLCLIGDVLPAALHLAGTFTLHGSAVALGGVGAAFVAPKYHGKSTLARALLRSGARLASDDCVPLRPGEPVVMQPGVHHVRLWGDAASHFAADPTGETGVLGPKYVVRDLPDSHLVTDALPLAAVYVLAPVAPDPQRPWAVRRTPLPPVDAALALLQHSKIGPFLSGAEASAMFRQATTISRGVSVYRLEIVRDFDRLDEVAAEIAAWHAEPAHREDAGVLV